MGYRFLIHDYSGHPLHPPLSRRLAARGHEVLHVYSQSVVIPQGALQPRSNDPRTLRFAGLRVGARIDKQAYLQRYFQERWYGRSLCDEIERFKPGLVISSSTPLDAQAAALKQTQAIGGRFVFWLQDIQGIAIKRLLGARFGGVGKLAGSYYSNMERQLLQKSDAVVAITDDFYPTLRSWGVESHLVHLIPNWAPLDELPERTKDNEWARTHGLADKMVFLYSGTLGLKHDPGVLLRLAKQYRERTDVVVVVVSEGAKADWLKAQCTLQGLTNLRILPFQPYPQVPDVMATADVLVAILEADAGAFSVPSKVLSYHCAGRPLLLCVPPENLAARTVTKAQSGVVVTPEDVDGFLRQAELLRTSADLRVRMGKNARRYAEATFDLERITDRFEALFVSLLSGHRATDPAGERIRAV